MQAPALLVYPIVEIDCVADFLKGSGYDTANIFAEKVTPDEFASLYPRLPTAFSPATDPEKCAPSALFYFPRDFYAQYSTA
ncbi:MAG: hypothetical protein FWC42_06235 [Proteobacteria bacterium]|nr:hypothetical protein [Pseudomonadota bacterium]